MNISDLPALQAFQLPPGHVLYRVQSTSRDPTRIFRGPLSLYGGPDRLGRFDLTHKPTAYFATLPQTALHEAVYRKNTRELKRHDLEGRELIAVATTAALSLADLRPYASHLPVLQSVRQGETRELADALLAAGFDGLICRSAQQGDHDCVILFDPPTELLRLLWRSSLTANGGSGREWSVVAALGARIPYVG